MNTDNVKSILGKVGAALKKITKRMWILAAIVVVAIAAAVAIYLNTRPYALLFTGLSPEDASTVMSQLNTWGVRDYRWENNDTILVPEDDVNQLIARFVTEGYPGQGFSYDSYYDHVSALSTEVERNQAWLITVQQKMEAVIACFDGVQSASVTITEGQDRSYVLDSGNVVEASAGIVVTMKPGQKLNTKLATQIRSFVASSIQGVKIENVTLTDNYGNSYNADDDSASASASDLKMRLEEETENKIRTSVKAVLDPLYGEDNVKVSASVLIDVSNSIVDDYESRLPEYAQDGSTNGAGIIGSRVFDYSARADEDTITGGTVGTGVNSDLPTTVEQEPTPEDIENRYSGSGQVDYDNPNTKTHTTYNYGRIVDCTVSVSINQNTAKSVDMGTIRAHVASASGITPVVTEEMTAEEYLESKISIVCEPFFENPDIPDLSEPEQFQIELWMIIAAAVGLLLFVIILTVILLIRGRKKQKKQKEEEEAAAVQEQLMTIIGVPELEAAGGADVMSLQTEKSMELRKNIRQFAEENPEVAAQLLRTWLRGGGDGNA